MVRKPSPLLHLHSINSYSPQYQLDVVLLEASVGREDVGRSIAYGQERDPGNAGGESELLRQQVEGRDEEVVGLHVASKSHQSRINKLHLVSSCSDCEGITYCCGQERDEVDQPDGQEKVPQPLSSSELDK